MAHSCDYYYYYLIFEKVLLQLFYGICCDAYYGGKIRQTSLPSKKIVCYISMDISELLICIGYSGSNVKYYSAVINVILLLL